ncbi:MAG: hypothetical protein HQL22_01085 [Candidatus Omnitrophica bacterium]|nr:hypothetical protein [Candidatus Omnitrophota bacterium]
MGYHTAITISVFIILAAAIGNGIVKNASRHFADDPTVNAYQGDAIRQQVSEKTQETAERQRRMMENVKTRMERNKF